MKRGMACDHCQEDAVKPKPLQRHITRACIVVKRLPWTNTKPSRFRVECNGIKKTYGLGVIPADGPDNDLDQAAFVVNLFCKDRGLDWQFVTEVAYFKDQYIFVAR